MLKVHGRYIFIKYFTLVEDSNKLIHILIHRKLLIIWNESSTVKIHPGIVTHMGS